MRDCERRNRGSKPGRVSRESLLSVASLSASPSDTVLEEPGWEQRRAGQPQAPLFSIGSLLALAVLGVNPLYVSVPNTQGGAPFSMD